MNQKRFIIKYHYDPYKYLLLRNMFHGQLHDLLNKI